jgi:hypothetical protein
MGSLCGLMWLKYVQSNIHYHGRDYADTIRMTMKGAISGMGKIFLFTRETIWNCQARPSAQLLLKSP